MKSPTSTTLALAAAFIATAACSGSDERPGPPGDGAPGPPITTYSWFPTTDTSLTNIDVQYAAFVTASDYATAHDSTLWSVPTYAGGGGYSFGGGNPASCFMSAWAVEKSGDVFSYISNESAIRTAAENFAAEVTKFLLAEPEKPTHIDFDIEEGYPTLACIDGMPALLGTAEGQRFYGHAIHALAKQATAHGWKFNLDIQEPYLSLPFRSFEYTTTCPTPTTTGYTTCAPWMPTTWNATAKASVKGGQPFFSAVTLLVLNNTPSVHAGDKFMDAGGDTIDFTVDGSGPDTWTMMGYPLDPGLFDVKSGAGGFGPYLMPDGSIDVKSWMAGLFGALPSGVTGFSERLVYATTFGTIADGHVEAAALKTALDGLSEAGFPLAGVAYWNWLQAADVNTYLGEVKTDP